MCARLRDERWRVGVAAFYALAMLLLGFAHVPVAAQGARPDLSAFALPDGSLPNICFGKEEGGKGAHLQGAVCAACLLTAGADLPPHAAGLDGPVAFSPVLPFLAVVVSRAGTLLKTQYARGPPSALA